MVAYRLLAKGHACLQHSPVTLNSFRQNVCVFVLQTHCTCYHITMESLLGYLALKEQNPFFMTPHITWDWPEEKLPKSLFNPAQLTSSLCIFNISDHVGCTGVKRSKFVWCALIWVEDTNSELLYREKKALWSTFLTTQQVYWVGLLTMAGEDAAMRGWRAYFNTFTVPGRRNVKLCLGLSWHLIHFWCFHRLSWPPMAHSLPSYT